MTEPVADRERRARLANMRQELLAPVTGLVGYGELLSEEADRLELGELAPDLERILTAAKDLLELVNRLLDEAAASDRPSPADLDVIQVKIRHDLRNPLNAIKGYAELLLEELDELGGAPLRADLEALLTESESLLARIDVIVDFSRARAAPSCRPGPGRARQHGRQSGPDRETDRGAGRAAARRPVGSWWSTTTPATATSCSAASSRDGHQGDPGRIRPARARAPRDRRVRPGPARSDDAGPERL